MLGRVPYLLPYFRRGTHLFPSLNSAAISTHSENDATHTDTSQDQAPLLDAALHHVFDLGWSDETLQAGARDINISAADVPLLVPQGPVTLVHHLIRKNNAALSSHPTVQEHLHKQKSSRDHDYGESDGEEATAAESVAERLSIVSRARLEMLVPYLQHGHWLNAMALGALPQNSEATARLALETVDEIWYVAGDRSVDYKWYTRRGSFVPGYCATELYLLSDESENYDETWTFLDWHVTTLFGNVDIPFNGDGGATSSQHHHHATMLDTMSVATKGAVSLGAALASIGSAIIKESGSAVAEKMEEKKSGRRF